MHLAIAGVAVSLLSPYFTACDGDMQCSPRRDKYKNRYHTCDALNMYLAQRGQAKEERRCRQQQPIRHSKERSSKEKKIPTA